jgi:hypothetical protein
MEIFVFWIVLALVVGALGKDRKIGFGLAFFLSLILSPLIGLVIVLLSDKKNIQTEYNWVKEYELGKKAEYKGQTDIAIDYYLNALYYLENDKRKLNKKVEISKQESITRLKNRVENLKQLKLKAKL